MHYLFYITVCIVCFVIITACGSGKYGVNCLETCSPYCADPAICHNQDGVCDCVEWATGKTCDHMIGMQSVFFVKNKIKKNVLFFPK